MYFSPEFYIFVMFLVLHKSGLKFRVQALCAQQDSLKRTQKLCMKKVLLIYDSKSHEILHTYALYTKQ